MHGYRRMIAWGLAVIGLGMGRVDAAPLDPSSPIFTSRSQGNVTLTSGNYAFLLGTDTPTLVRLGGPTFGTVATGFIFNGINVFDFSSLQIEAGANITVTQSSASGPIALLSSSSISMAGTIDVSAVLASAGPGASNAFVGGNGSGGAVRPGAGGAVVSGGGGGGFGGFGQSAANVPFFFDANTGQFTSFLPGGIGGGGYTNLIDRIQGGSAGGLGGFVSSPFGGGGGGAIELGALGTVSVSGTILANGGNAIGLAGQFNGGSGGGSGGGVLINGSSINLSGTITALGGNGSPIGSGATNTLGRGGDGGGGAVLAVYGGFPGSFVNTATIQVGNGQFGVAIVPEPSSLILLGMAALGGVGAIRWRGRSR